jgi:hypothetical protein
LFTLAFTSEVLLLADTPGGELGGTWASPTVDATHSGSPHHAAATVSGTPDYITLSGQDIVRGLVDLAADVTGELPAAAVGDPIATCLLKDDFMGGNVTSGSIGELGWTLTVVGTGAISAAAGTAGYPGQVTLTTGATTGSYAVLQIPAGAMPIIGSDLWDITWIVKTGASLANGMVINLGLSSAPAIPIAYGTVTAAFTYSQGTDTYWTALLGAAAAQTKTATNITPATATWYKFRIVRSATDVKFYINGVLKVTDTTTLPATGMYPFLYILNASAAARTLTPDLFTCRITGLAR